jgi:all-trans-8'-apo-beta-carotenal 15,15'-oxygenase
MRNGMTRRTAMITGMAAGTAAALSGALVERADAELAPAPEWLTLLGKSERGGRDTEPRIEGRVPAGLTGSLYRNGPGLFERGAYRKPHILDGDGLVQRLSFADGKVRYQNQFVRTHKFDAEAQANTYVYPTWSMLAPGGFWRNMGGNNTPSQAGVTVYPFNGKLYAFDEVSPPWTLDPATLKTEGPHPLGDPSKTFMIKAHTKFDPATGDWLLAGLSYGRTMQVHAITYGADGRLKSHQTVESPRQIYLHDFFATDKHFVFVLQPMMFSPWLMLAGFSTFIESLSWQGEQGNIVMILPRGGGAPRFIEAPGAYMWHALNAYESHNEIVADFVGYDAPDHFAPKGAAFYEIMQGKLGTAREPGTLRRYRIDLKRGTCRQEIADQGGHEFPMVDPRVALHPHKIGFMTFGANNAFNSGVKRFDYESGRATHFDFGPKAVAGEPVFAAAPGGAENEGWLISQVLDGTSGKSYFAILDASHVEAGPVAKIWLDHHLPISFHGAWKAA